MTSPIWAIVILCVMTALVLYSVIRDRFGKPYIEHYSPIMGILAREKAENKKAGNKTTVTEKGDGWCKCIVENIEGKTWTVHIHELGHLIEQGKQFKIKIVGESNEATNN